MSHRLISLSSDLKRLQDEGYEVAILSNYLVLDHIPYVDTERNVRFGRLVSELTLAGDITAKPETHVVMFSGTTPCDKDGNPLTKIINASAKNTLAEGLEIDHTFSSKPLGGDGYSDYYSKMTTYETILSGPAELIDRTATAKTFRVIEERDEDSPFRYLDTASSRASIEAASQKLRLGSVALVGLGGTGSYILDFVAKTPVREIHIFDGDHLLQHNAFRAPGAPSIDQLAERPDKVAYLLDQYSKMHKNIIPHPHYVDEESAEELKNMSFVFLAMDSGTPKKIIVSKLHEYGVPFIDVGMGVYEDEGTLAGVVRVTTSTPDKRDHIAARIPFSDGDAANDYSRNIQIAELNALNAALAVIKWKKLCGYYRDLENEYFSAYTLDGNHLVNEDQA